MAVDVVRILLAVTVLVVAMAVSLAMIVSVMMMAVPVVMAAFIGLGLQPLPDVGALGLGIVEAGIEDLVGVDLARGNRVERCAGIEVVQPVLQFGELGRIGDVDLGQQDAVGDGGLLYGLLVIVERARAVDAVDRRHHAVEAVARGEQRVGHQRVQDGRGIGQAGGLDHHALERRDLAARALEEQLAHGAHEVAAHRAAQAARVQRHHAFVVGLLDQQMVEANLAELVDDDGGVGQFGPAQQLVEQRGLAAAEEARQDGDGNALLGGVLRIAHRDILCSGFTPARSARPS